jgi:hypothetical protein
MAARHRRRRHRRGIGPDAIVHAGSDPQLPIPGQSGGCADRIDDRMDAQRARRSAGNSVTIAILDFRFVPLLAALCCIERARKGQPSLEEVLRIDDADRGPGITASDAVVTITVTVTPDRGPAAGDVNEQRSRVPHGSCAEASSRLHFFSAADQLSTIVTGTDPASSVALLIRKR